MSSDCQPALHEIAADDLSTWLREVAGKCSLSNPPRVLLYRFGCNFLKRASAQKLYKRETPFEKSKGEVRNALLHYP